MKTNQIRQERERLDKLLKLERALKEKQLGQSNYEYRNYIETIRQRVITAIKEIKINNA